MVTFPIVKLSIEKSITSDHHEMWFSVLSRSASGNIITEALAAHFPTIIVYVMDTVRSTNPVTFMSVSLFNNYFNNLTIAFLDDFSSFFTHYVFYPVFWYKRGKIIFKASLDMLLLKAYYGLLLWATFQLSINLNNSWFWKAKKGYSMPFRKWAYKPFIKES